MITQHATPPKFGTQPVEDDDLFTLIPQTCADCQQPFAASRRAARCALCASLRNGQVGAATVVCPACGVEHQIAILAPHKFCPACVAAAAEADDLAARLDADVAHTDDTTRARFEAAVALLQTGVLGERQLTTEQVRAAWQRAIDRADDLSPLLSRYDRATAAALAQLRMAD